jgi:hypothetical protein
MISTEGKYKWLLTFLFMSMTFGSRRMLFTIDSTNPFVLTDIIDFGNAQKINYGFNIDSYENAAMQFFNTRFGIDFSNTTRDAIGARTLVGTGVMYPLKTAANVNYIVEYDTNPPGTILDSDVQEVGYLVFITNDGEYGGEYGLARAAGDLLAYSEYRVEKTYGDGSGSNVKVDWIHNDGNWPLKQTGYPDGTSDVSIKLAITDTETNETGLAAGSSVQIKDATGVVHRLTRNVLNFD